MSGADTSIQLYVRQDFSMVDFAPGAVIADIGCGTGRFLSIARQRGIVAIGIEPSPDRVAECITRGLNAREGVAERLPLDSESCDGIICNVALPYTDEKLAILEWGRVLRPRGEVRASFHGAGYPLRQLVLGPSLAVRFYGLRTLLNTWFYRVTGCRLPDWMGDTIYQSDHRLRRYYAIAGLEIADARRGKRFLGMPVFIYHYLVRVR